MAEPVPVAWLRSEELPYIPPGAPKGCHGWTDRQGAHATWEATDVLDALAGDAERTILLAWRPDPPGGDIEHMFPVHEVFPDAALGRDAAARARKRASERRSVAFAAALVVGFAALFLSGRQLPSVLVLGIMLFGMSPFERAIDFFENREAERLYRSDPARAAQLAGARTRYMLWFSRQGRGVAGPGLATAFVLIYLLQWKLDEALGGHASIAVAGLVKPRVPLEPYRLLTAAYMHGSLLHLGGNALMTVMMARVLEPLLGAGRTLWIFVLGALAGNLASTWLLDAPSVGASGGIMAFVGALAGFGVRRSDLRNVGLYRMGVRILLLMVVVGLMGAHFIDNAAHAGGALGGFGLGVFMAARAGDPVLRHKLAPVSLLGFVAATLPALLTAALLLNALQ